MPARAVMVLGTASHVGKSLLVAALCRILRQDGIRVVNRVSFNGGPGGVAARPTPDELAARGEEHLPATSVQTRHQRIAARDRNSLASVNHGTPANAAVAVPLSRENRPPGFQPLQAEDRTASKEHLVDSYNAAPAHYGAHQGHDGGADEYSAHPVRPAPAPSRPHHASSPRASRRSE